MQVVSHLSVEHSSFAVLSTVRLVTQVQLPYNWNVESRAVGETVLVAAVALVVMVQATRNEFDIENDVKVCK